LHSFLNSISQINTAVEFARAKGGRVNDISRLRPGQFYVAGEDVAGVAVNRCAAASGRRARPRRRM
jgi:hypothetical protein